MDNDQPTYTYEGQARPMTLRLINGHRVRAFIDHWRGGKARIMRYQGRCRGCGLVLWAFDDGENDPRGFLGDHAGHDLSEDGQEPINACALCANDYNSYQAIMSQAER